MKISHCLFIFFVSTALAFGQGGNPANRYLNAYKKYQNAACPLESDGIKHFIYFSRNREQIHGHPFLSIPRIVGAQIMYSWRQLEPERGVYDFSILREDYVYLLAHGKKLFVQFQDVSFDVKYKAIPDYLLSEEYEGGCTLSFDDLGHADGWVVKKWNRNVQERFALLMQALGKEFDGKIEGVNLQETAIGIDKSKEVGFSPKRYSQCIKENMLALKKAFPQSTTMQYANFMPDEWLPWEDKGYLRSIYAYGQEIGVGLGGPDLMVTRKGQLNHALALMHENDYTVPLGIAVQDGNYIGKTGADEDYSETEDRGQAERKNVVPLLHAFAQDFLKVSYMFWVHQEPYIVEDVMPCFRGN
ncbi:hypothetical protein LAG90_12125 [Marinilongibacter aquaticus]|uniref:hypothetical protein n=1 Tax=Marinilongibacter aquaticus TaxID=2975157 RepID=UPI0021BD0B10|nr:hypothetical protein [Marinilongibacter aquaticus]UBM57565.1 hypothetical protein LAG90_12125 [Marinilongibacter aquaticus]